LTETWYYPGKTQVEAFFPEIVHLQVRLEKTISQVASAAKRTQENREIKVSLFWVAGRVCWIIFPERHQQADAYPANPPGAEDKEEIADDDGFGHGAISPFILPTLS
jgi:type IV secretory pathway VirB9-like protein